LEVFADGPEIRFCRTGEVEALGFEQIADSETTQTFLFVYGQIMEHMGTSGLFGQITSPRPFINPIPCKIKYDGRSCLEDVDDRPQKENRVMFGGRFCA
jgi:hypothetical protein